MSFDRIRDSCNEVRQIVSSILIYFLPLRFFATCETVISKVPTIWAMKNSTVSLN